MVGTPGTVRPNQWLTLHVTAWFSWCEISYQADFIVWFLSTFLFIGEESDKKKIWILCIQC